MSLDSSNFSSAALTSSSGTIERKKKQGNKQLGNTKKRKIKNYWKGKPKWQ